MTNLQNSASPVRPDNDHVCLYSSYFTQTGLPYFVRVYLEQLLPHFGRIVLLTNDDRALDQESLQWLAARDIELMPVRNEGYDFGMWQKAIRRYPELTQSQRLCLANDSCLCFAPLNDFFTWAANSKAEAAGLVKSYERGEHLQSYLLVITGRAIAVAIQHIEALDLSATSYDTIVNDGEVGLSRSLLASGIPLQAYHTPDHVNTKNPAFVHSVMLIDAGIPLIKRKLLNYTPRFLIRHAVRSGHGISRLYYFQRILAKHPDREAQTRVMFEELPPISLGDRIWMHRQFIKFWLLNLIRSV